MTMRRRREEAPRSKPKSKSLPSSPVAAELRRITLLLEDMDHRNRANIDAIYSVRDELGAKIEAQGERIAALEFGMRDVVSRLVVLDTCVQSHTAMLAKINATLGDHTKKLDDHSRKLDDHSRKLDDHSRKLDEHSRKLDEFGSVQADHSERLRRIEAKLDLKADKKDLLALEERVTRLEKIAAS
jgi:chromosome segregation ATPase